MRKANTLLLVILLSLALPGTLKSQENYYVGGERSSSPPPPAMHPSSGTASLAAAWMPGSANRTMTMINFDDVLNAPMTFISANPLRYEYSGYGVYFYGPNNSDGGALLNEGSGFGVSGHSPPNFVAFNTGSSMSNGGIPQGPEDIEFWPPVSYVEIKAGSGAAGTIDMFAYDEEGTLIDFDQVTGTDPLQVMSVTGERIAKVTIQFSGIWLVLDDLVFDTYLAPDNLEANLDPAQGIMDMEWDYASINGFSEDFTDGVADNWIPVTGTWSVWGDMYEVNSGTMESSNSFYNHDFTSLDMEISVAKTVGNDCNIGLFFHANPTQMAANGVFNDGYQLVVCTNGDWNLHGYQNGGFIGFLQNWITSPDLYTGLGSFNTLRVVVAAGNMDVYFNGVLQGSYFDNTLTSGKVVLRMYDDGFAGTATFDYVHVSLPLDGYTFGKAKQDDYREIYTYTEGCGQCPGCEGDVIGTMPAPIPPEEPFVFENTSAFNHFNVYRNANVIATPSVPGYQNSLPDYGIYGYDVTAQYDEGESNGAGLVMAWWIEDPILVQNPAPPAGWWIAYTSDLNAVEPYKVYDNFQGVTELITGMEFAGINAMWMYPGWDLCDGEDPMSFEITFYEDDAGEPGTVVETFILTIPRVNTNLFYGWDLYHYRATFPTEVDLEEGWVSVQGISVGNPDDCWFLWVGSYEGDLMSYQWDGVALSPLSIDLTMALIGGWVPPVPSNLQATLYQQTGQVDLTWVHTPSPNRGFLYYIIYRDGVNIGISLDHDYTDNLPAYGTYEYTVTAYYDEGESLPTDPETVNWTNVGIEESLSGEVKVYPNPVRDHIRIIGQTEITRVEIYNLLGEPVYTLSNISDKEIVIRNLDLSEGIYVIRCHSDGVCCRKISVSN